MFTDYSGADIICKGRGYFGQYGLYVIALLSYHVDELFCHQLCPQQAWGMGSVGPICNTTRDDAVLHSSHKFGGFIW